MEDQLPGSFKDFVINQTAAVNPLQFLLNLALALALSLLISFLYVRYGTSLSNRRNFAANFVLVALTTAGIITIVKSSLALSLGLVGALSIVRFRSAIKEPEELAYLFITILIGLGCGAGQRLITIIAVVALALVVMGRHFMRRQTQGQHLHLLLSSAIPAALALDKLVPVLQRHCATVALHRYDETPALTEASFGIELNTYHQLTELRKELQNLDQHVTISLLDDRGLGV